jgi:hypothetical protein
MKKETVKIITKPLMVTKQGAIQFGLASLSCWIKLVQDKIEVTG